MFRSKPNELESAIVAGDVAVFDRLPTIRDAGESHSARPRRRDPRHPRD
jgi:hypothetical protein